MKQILIEDDRALSLDALAQLIRHVDGNHSLGAGALAEAIWPFVQRRESSLRWPSVMHPAHAAALDSARAWATSLEQELAETQRRCTALIHLWTTSGSMAHAAQLAEALDLGAES